MLSPSAGGASMSRSFVAVGATIATLLLGTPALANTYHVHVRAGGPVGVVRGPGPVVVRGPVYVRGPGRVWVHRPHYGYRTYWNPYWYGYWYPVPLATVGVGVTYGDVYPAAPGGRPPPRGGRRPGGAARSADRRRHDRPRDSLRHRPPRLPGARRARPVPRPPRRGRARDRVGSLRLGHRPHRHPARRQPLRAARRHPVSAVPRVRRRRELRSLRNNQRRSAPGLP